ncbi:NB-ARC domain-containing protein [Almyronema epifaneia]|uniref:NB-ARC domain-containing protein n=1 Tax=Almyronema epifaneia S1 TaxID=2991925 RepID=A0ABW6IHA7_9CYAN
MPELISSLLEWANWLVEDYRGRPLSPLQLKLLQGILMGHDYRKIYRLIQEDPDPALFINSVNTLQRSTAYQLWNLLSGALQHAGFLQPNQRVSKHNVKAYLERSQQKQAVLRCSAVDQAELHLAATSGIKIDFLGDCIRWVGREQELEYLSQKLTNCRLLALVGISGIGKTSLAARLAIALDTESRFSRIASVRFEKKDSNFLNLAQAILGSHCVNENLAASETLLERVMSNLRETPQCFILDMVEEAFEIASGNSPTLDPWIYRFLDEFVRTRDTQSLIIVTSQLKLPVFAEGRYTDRTYEYKLKGLSAKDAFDLFTAWGIQDTTEPESRHILQQCIHTYEGHPLALKVIAGDILNEPFIGNIQAYWHDYGAEIEYFQQWMAETSKNQQSYPKLDAYSLDLAELVQKRIQRSLDQLEKTAPLAHQLLCMGATYRQAVERQAWLCLMTESSTEALNTAFQVLQRRFLLEPERTSSRILYRLHNLIRCTALARLKTWKHGKNR